MRLSFSSERAIHCVSRRRPLLVDLAYDIARRIRDGERDLARLAQGRPACCASRWSATPASTGSCPRWTPSGSDWSQVELDLVSGFHRRSRWTARRKSRRPGHRLARRPARASVVFHPLVFLRGSGAAVPSSSARLADRISPPRISRTRFLVTYPIPDERLDSGARCFATGQRQSDAANDGTDGGHPSAGRERARRRRPAGMDGPALPRPQICGVEAGGQDGLHSRLYAATADAASSQAYMQEFLRIMREVSFATLERIEPLQPARGRAIAMRDQQPTRETESASPKEFAIKAIKTARRSRVWNEHRLYAFARPSQFQGALILGKRNLFCNDFVHLDAPPLKVCKRPAEAVNLREGAFDTNFAPE